MTTKYSEPHQSSDDEFWIREYLTSDDQQYWGNIFEKYKKTIFLVCLKLLDDKEEASDLTSETFIKAFENIDKYDLKRPFAPWIKQIANNLCIDRLRRKTLVHITNIDEKANFQTTEDISKKIETRELREKILQSIRSLKTHQKRCFCLFYIHRKSYKDIVEFTGYSHSDVRTYIQNGKRKFKLAMQE
jgi:RNA polymerase sigma-70 factor (ECF subfamily)